MGTKESKYVNLASKYSARQRQYMVQCKQSEIPVRGICKDTGNI